MCATQTPPNPQIKRKKHPQQGENEDDNSEKDSDSDDDSDSDSEDEEEDVCPAGCDNALFEKIFNLRDERLEIEESLSEMLKTVESTKKETESLSKKLKVSKSRPSARNRLFGEFCCNDLPPTHNTR